MDASNGFRILRLDGISRARDPAAKGLRGACRAGAQCRCGRTRNRVVRRAPLLELLDLPFAAPHGRALRRTAIPPTEYEPPPTGHGAQSQRPKAKGQRPRKVHGPPASRGQCEQGHPGVSGSGSMRRWARLPNRMTERPSGDGGRLERLRKRHRVLGHRWEPAVPATAQSGEPGGSGSMSLIRRVSLCASCVRQSDGPMDVPQHPTHHLQ